jgi:glycosyltransferase involved in cell wall biosynthesis
MTRLRALFRLVRHLALLGIAVVGGLLPRLMRKLLGRKPHIWHGLSTLFWEVYLVQADRFAGYESRILLREHSQSRYLATLLPDVRILGEIEGVRQDEVHWTALRDLFWWGDIKVAYFDVMYFGPSLPWANRLMLQLMKLVGIRIIVAAHGGDVTYRSRYRSRYDWVGRVQLTNPDWDLVATAPATLRRIKMYCDTADLVLPADPALSRFLPRNDILFKYFPVDTDALRNVGVSEREIPVVVHAPSSRWNKGSDYVFAALDSLQAKGIQFELRLVEKLPRAEALRRYEEADVLVDQLCIGAYGTLAVESLALGKPTLTYLDQETLGDPIYDVPLVNANPENVECVLAVLLQVRELRQRLATASRHAAERYHSIEALSEVWDRIYQHLWRGTPLRLAETRHFEATRKPRSFTEDPAALDFWPVPVDDLADSIQQALQKAGFATKRELRRKQEHA